MNFREPSRPFDPTAMSLLNLVIHEHRPLGEDGEPIFVPSHGPYYSESLAVYSGARLLVRGVDYRTLVHHPRATEKTGKEVSVCVQVINKSLTEIDITYQAVGGDFQHLFEIVKLIKESNGDHVLRRILWHEIVGKPTSFNPAAHWHVVWDFSGWEALITPLDQIRNAIIFKKQKAYRDAYDYYYAKAQAHRTDVEGRLTTLRQKATDLWKRIRQPIGVINLYTKAQDAFEDGQYVEMKETLLFGVATDADLGKKFDVSKDLVFPYPDNVLLNELKYPILQEKDEWIYLDNEHPVSPLVLGEPYWEEIDELFDALCIKIYNKTTHGGEFDARIATDKTVINENEVAVITVTTVGFKAGTVVPYQITGVGPDNVSVPLLGTLTLNSVGVGTLAVKLIPDSARTDLDIMNIEVMIMGGLKISVKYNLNSNQVQKTETTVHGFANGPLLQGPMVRGDRYVLNIQHRGVDGKVLKLKTGLTATDRIIVNGTEYAGNVEVSVPVVAGSKQMNVNFTVKSRVGTSAGDLGLTLSTPDGTTEAIAATVEPYKLLALEFYNPDTGAIITETKYSTGFKIRVKQNSKDNPLIDLQLNGNTTTGEMSPSFIPPLYCNKNGVGETATYMVLPVNNVEPTAGVLTYTAVDPVTGINLKSTLQVTI